jgi:histidine triad (HIT) family protein
MEVKTIMCVFCDIINGKIPSKKVYEDEDVLAILDISQLTYGHTIVMPKKHVENILEADDETIAKCMRTVHMLARQIKDNTGCPGLNVINNCGTAAGQSVPHLHFHIIPRYDKNDGFGYVETPHEENLDEVLARVKGE